MEKVLVGRSRAEIQQMAQRLLSTGSADVPAELEDSDDGEEWLVSSGQDTETESDIEGPVEVAVVEAKTPRRNWNRAEHRALELLSKTHDHKDRAAFEKAIPTRKWHQIACALAQLRKRKALDVADNEPPLKKQRLHGPEDIAPRAQSPLEAAVAVAVVAEQKTHPPYQPLTDMGAAFVQRLGELKVQEAESKATLDAARSRLGSVDQELRAEMAREFASTNNLERMLAIMQSCQEKIKATEAQRKQEVDAALEKHSSIQLNVAFYRKQAASAAGSWFLSFGC